MRHLHIADLNTSNWTLFLLRNKDLNLLLNSDFKVNFTIIKTKTGPLLRYIMIDLAVPGNLRSRLAYLVGSLDLLILQSDFLVEPMLKNWETFAVSLGLFGSRMDLTDYLLQLSSASQKLWCSDSACLGTGLELRLLPVSTTFFPPEILISTKRIL